jgi:eukaryotic-like serine/threonine-protein kinase
VVKSAPDWSLLPAATPAGCRRLLLRCLEKDPHQRLRDIGDAGLELASSDIPAAHRDLAGGGSRVALGLWLTAGLLIGGAIVGTASRMSRGPRQTPAPVVRTILAAPAPLETISPSFGNVDVSISDDGRVVAYLTGAGGKEQLYVRRIEQLEATQILEGGLGEIRGPVISPDGQWIAFLDETAHVVKRISTSGGTAITCAQLAVDSGAARGIVWDGNANIVLATQSSSSGILRVHTTGGVPEALTTPSAGHDHFFPHVVTGHGAVLFTVTTPGAPNQIAVRDLKSGAEKTLIQNGSSARYTPSGHLLYVADGSMYAVRFDPATLVIHGEPMQVLRDLAVKSIGAAQYGFSSNGTLTYLRGSSESQNLTMVWVDRSGHEEPTLAPPRPYAYARLSPDGTVVAVDIRDQQSDIWTWDIARRTLTPVSRSLGIDRAPVWSPNGKRLAFGSQRDGKEGVYWQNADGTGLVERIVSADRPLVPYSFSPDGKGLVVGGGEGPYDLAFSLLGGSYQPILAGPYDERGGVISPDGRWLAYESNESGTGEIYVRPFPSVDTGRWLVSRQGGTRPLWSKNGRELFYYIRPGNIMVVPVTNPQTPSFGDPQLVVAGPYPAPFGGRQFDVSPDGRRFLLLKAAENRSSHASSQLVIVQNWFDELQRLVPTD